MNTGGMIAQCCFIFIY